MVKINIEGSVLSVVSFYNPAFPAAAKRIGGRWKAPAWVFDSRDEAKVRALCVSIYGTDGSPVEQKDLLTVRVALDDSGALDGDNCSEWLAGRRIASCRGRDSGATLGEGVILVSGNFGSGGSMKNPRITHRPGTVAEIRDVPRAAAEKAHAEYHGVTLLDSEGDIVREPTKESGPEPVLQVVEVAALAEIEIDPAPELAAVEIDIAAAEGRLFGLKFRRAELAAQ